MPYTNVPIGTENPGSVIILLDQSSSMSDSFGEGTKAEEAAKAVNRIIYEIAVACQDRETIKDRVYVGVIGYGGDKEERFAVLVDGMISELYETPLRMETYEKLVPDGAGGYVKKPFDYPVWIEPAAVNGTPMEAGFGAAVTSAERWIEEHPDSFPPIVINITDGKPNDPTASEDAARALMDLQSNDGPVLVLNAHIADPSGSGASNQIVLPSSTAEIQGVADSQYAAWLFNLSSELPETMINKAKEVGFTPGEDARGFVFNADAGTLIGLIHFGTLGTIEPSDPTR